MRYTSIAIVALAASSVQAGVLNDWNLIVATNVTSTSEVEGRAIIGGNLGGTSSNYATRLTPASSFLNVDALVIGGGLSAQNIQVNGGRARLAGSRGSTNFNMNGGGALIQNDASVASFITSAIAEMNAASATLRTLPTTAGSTVAIPGGNGQPGPLNFDVGAPVGNGVAVFNLNAAQIFSNNFVQEIGINLRAASSVVINVAGSSVNFNQGNFIGSFNSLFARANVLWNFYEATSIDLGSRAFNGALLAPSAHLTFEGVVEGSVFVRSLDQRGEVHLPLYTGFVPTPGAATLLALAGVVATRRRRD